MVQYNIEIFSCCLRLLPFYSSTYHQTNVENSQIRAEDNLLISRIQSLHPLLDVDHHDEEEYSVILTLGKRYAKKFPGSTSVQDLSQISTVLVDEQAQNRLLWEARSRPGCQVPQRKCAGYLSTTSWKLKLSGRRKNRVIREMEIWKKK